jgi:hypothetical protein
MKTRIVSKVIMFEKILELKNATFFVMTNKNLLFYNK